MYYENTNNWETPVRNIKGAVELFTSSPDFLSGETIQTKEVFSANSNINAWVESKNMIPFPYVDTTATINGMTFTVNENGSVTINGTASTDTVFVIADNIRLTPGMYSLSGSIDMLITLEVTTASGKQFYYGDNTFEVTEEATAKVYIDIWGGYRASGLSMSIMLERGSTASKYMKYINVTNVNVIVNHTMYYKVDEAGNVINLKLLKGKNTITTDTAGVMVNIKYNAIETTGVFLGEDRLKSFSIERLGDEGKFFGFGICQKVNIKLVNLDNAINISTANAFKCYLSAGGKYISTTPTFFVTEVHKDENTNELSITAYDLLYWGTEHLINEATFTDSYMLYEILVQLGYLFGSNDIMVYNFENDYFLETILMLFEYGANIEGSETIREISNAICEVLLSCYYIDNNDCLVFKAITPEVEPVLTISKDIYIELDSKTNRRLTGLASVTELGENIEQTSDITGTTQYLRENPFLNINETTPHFLQRALNVVNGLTFAQFACKWRGNYFLEPADFILLETKENETIKSYIVNDVIEYNGALSQFTSWTYGDSTETETTPATLGEALKQTYARVDKVNKEVEILVNETAQLKMDAESLNINISTLTDELNTKATTKDINTAVQAEMSNGVTKVTTTTGYTFNNEGLTISKTDSEISTIITDNGMKIYKNNKEVLTANNQGVKATDLHATTYLIIGNNSRLEDYGSNRTACIWIG